MITGEVGRPILIAPQLNIRSYSEVFEAISFPFGLISKNSFLHAPNVASRISIKEVLVINDRCFIIVQLKGYMSAKGDSFLIAGHISYT
ncbi:hypothetical protein D3C86_2065730 [compost metagenome]